MRCHGPIAERKPARNCRLLIDRYRELRSLGRTLDPARLGGVNQGQPADFKPSAGCFCCRAFARFHVRYNGRYAFASLVSAVVFAILAVSWGFGWYVTRGPYRPSDSIPIAHGKDTQSSNTASASVAITVGVRFVDTLICSLTTDGRAVGSAKRTLLGRIGGSGARWECVELAC